MWELDTKEGWVLKNWGFLIVVLQKTFESFLDNKDIKSVNSKEINPEHSSKRLMLKLNLQNFDPLMWRTDSLKRPWCWERLRPGGEGGDRGRDDWMASSTHGHEFEQFLGIVKDREVWCAAVHGVTWSQTRLSDWTTIRLPLGIYEYLLNEQSMIIITFTPMSSIEFSSILDLDLLFIVHFVHNLVFILFMIITLCLYYWSLLFGRHSLKLEDCFQNNLNNCST